MAGNKRGFTLIEMVVATSILGMAIAIVAGTYAYSSRASQRARATARAADAATILLERLRFSISSRAIDYDEYGGGLTGSPIPKLHLISKDGLKESYYGATGADCGTGASPCLLYTDGVDVARLTPEDTSVPSVNFIVRPADPAYKIQPSVIIFMTITRADAPEALPFHLQTELLTRNYE